MQTNSRVKAEAYKQEETVAYMFTRTKALSSLISGFYTHCYGMKEPEGNKAEYVLSFEAIQGKLERVFKDYEALAKKPKRFEFAEVSDVESVRSGFNSLTNGKDKRSVSNNIAPKADSVFRSKSPAPTYKAHVENGFFGGKVWNEQNRMR